MFQMAWKYLQVAVERFFTLRIHLLCFVVSLPVYTESRTAEVNITFSESVSLFGKPLVTKHSVQG